ncbi:kinase-like protein [Myriangium duriaei CBS 260.36]|uniref:non-specific serine/threonine protein kinase n=1 Tax=Myriangium duriaei CBS 260.36 TaxID=1168546 RepID=A0A9P4ME67_9PEZI|nr:kinase-like protein [Myriangium duriaei CBS 260.36]
MASTEADKYEVLERIGQGSFGVIRKVRRKADGLVLCRKEICYTKMSDKERHQLQAELNILRQLDHPNIVQYFEKEHHKESHDLHLYMEYCGNGDLGIMIKDLKARHAFADEDLVWTVFAQLVSALYRCHYGEDPPSADTTAVGLSKNALPIKSKQACDRMILHRDLKPENVFLGDGNAVKLGDFGLSKIISSHDFASTYVGTPFYMSPEICAAERYSLYSDIWSLGCVIYELCSREPPFNAKTHFDLIQKIKIGKVAPLPRNYSRELSEVITACLQVNPNSRPDTAALLNLPRVKLIRKSQQSALMIQQHIVAKDQAVEELRLAREHIVQLEAERQTTYEAMHKKLLMEWEARATLEIDRRVQIAEKEFASLVEQRVEEEVSRRMSLLPSSQATSTTSCSSCESKTSMTRSSTPTTLHPEHSPSLPVLSESCMEDSISPRATDLSTLSLDDSPLEKRFKPVKRSSRTPFTRARTIANAQEIVPSPMDIQMCSPSPVRNLAGLSLSPRRTGTSSTDSTLISGLRQPMLRTNIFEQVNKPREAVSPSDDVVDFSDDEESPDSPTRPKSSADPFKQPFASRNLALPTRPGMLRQKTTPAQMGLNAHARKKSATNVFALAAATRPASPKDENIRPGSPARKLARPISGGPLASPARRAPAAPSQPSPTARRIKNGIETKDFGGLQRDLARAKIQGRTLVELSRNEVSNMQSRSSSEDEKSSRCAVWDPETEEMPSPFLVRGRKIIVGR